MSCALCLLSRANCSGAIPCGRCLTLGFADRCFHPPPSKRGRPRRAQPATAARSTQQLQLAAAPPPAGVPQPTPPQQQQQQREQEAATEPTSRSSGLTSTVSVYLLDMLGTCKAEMQTNAEKTRKARKKDKLRLQRMELRMLEMEQRMQELANDNSRLRNELALTQHFSATTTTSPGGWSCMTSDASAQFLFGPGGEGPASMRWPMDRLGCSLREDLLSRLPFLQHFNLPPAELIVHDLRAPICVMKTDHDYNPARTTPFFVSAQFSELLGHPQEDTGRSYVLDIAKEDKSNILHALLASELKGFSPVGHFNRFAMENGRAHLVQVDARYQFFTVQQCTYAVVCIDRVLGEDRTQLLAEIRMEQEAEWDQVRGHQIELPQTVQALEAPTSSSSSSHDDSSPQPWTDESASSTNSSSPPPQQPFAISEPADLQGDNVVGLEDLLLFGFSDFGSPVL